MLKTLHSNISDTYFILGEKLTLRGASKEEGRLWRHFFRHANIRSRASTFISPGREDKRSACHASGPKLHRK